MEPARARRFRGAVSRKRVEFASGPFLHSGDRPVLHRRLVTTRRTRVFVSSAMQILSAAEAVDAPSARQRIAFSVIFVSLRGVDTSLPRASNIGLRATGAAWPLFCSASIAVFELASRKTTARAPDWDHGRSGSLVNRAGAVLPCVTCVSRSFDEKHGLVGCARCCIALREARVLHVAAR